MIAMRQIAGRLALGLAAVTLTLTGTAGPAAAGQLDQPPPLALADIEVTARTKNTVGKTTTYTFQVRNHGPQADNNVLIYKAYRLDGPNGSMEWNGAYQSFALLSGQAKAITVSCTPPAGKTCALGMVAAYVNGSPLDPNGQNNMAQLN